MSALQAVPLAPRRPGRLWLITLAVALPLAAAIPATLVLWSGQDHSVQPAPTAPAVPLFDRAANATIYYTVDTSTVNATTASVLEFLMDSAPGQSVTSSQPDVLQRITPPSCHVPPLCELRNVSEFAFQARRPGSAVLTFHLSACPGGCNQSVVRKPVNVVLLPQVARGRPPA